MTRRESCAPPAPADKPGTNRQFNIDVNLRAGMTPEEARRQALLALAGLDQTKEQHRDQRAGRYSNI